MINLYYGNINDYDDIIYTIEIKPISSSQVLLYEFYILKKWMKKYTKRNWAISYNNDNTIILHFSNKKELSHLKLDKISNRFIIKNI